MLLSSLIGADAIAPAGAGNVEVAGLTSDSRNVRPGFVFAAIAGSKADGARFIADAVSKGAVAILAGQDAEATEAGDVPVVRAVEPRRALALMASRFYGLQQPDTTVAVTGTSGKTSVADFTRQIYAALGHKAASLGTIGVVKPDGAVYGSLTTPDPVSLHKTLAELAAEGITHLAFEASSHGLDQHRLDGVRIKAAAFTNLGRDHLDYHPTVEDYLAAKLRLFTELLPEDGTAVVNTDAEGGDRAVAAAEDAGRRVFTVGRTGEGLKLERLVREGFAQRMSVAHEGRVFDVRLPLLGDYQAANALVAAGLAIATGEVAGHVLPALQGLKGVKGRLEIVGEARGGMAVVDYAHKPEALAAVLDALRPFATGKLICVMGCGGDRDKGKRPIMGSIAVEKSDVVIVTDDNPRTEKPEAIRAEILIAAPGAMEIGDRAEAIARGVAMLGAGDVLVVAGKGHETGQIVGDRILPFSDHDEVRKALERD
ncbi:UDP-N-acetylmuramoyl-L-alanyl-D-glutamate--2,6-diaminopimelate ligase [Hyphomicrobium sp. NDB2Meth4]|uniref:UDP-N-acetylmuramoyl-L-alanyl-D-glutamate--2, 6-diaminopimelate ligase n=1 Tax=Hyphomicrobium sp. NDB2Meth4 TaxID=1892846 RepID=UPI00092FF198|nr:UDP-N-acetylmuramoyl-L-alanyl-D-glutamate--2,6-diaminopimelate ligase [Hyphomicrobium sp. NDB2Meth4]